MNVEQIFCFRNLKINLVYCLNRNVTINPAFNAPLHAQPATSNHTVIIKKADTKLEVVVALWLQSPPLKIVNSICNWYLGATADLYMK